MSYTTTERLIHLIDKDAVVNQACAADVLGVSKQRVSQIVKKHGLSLGQRKQPDTLISWPCPGCGAKREMWTRRRNNRAPVVLCKPCRAKEYRVTVKCDACGNERTRYRSELKHLKSNLCRPCHFIAHRPRMVALGRRNKFQDYCKYGHLLAETRRQDKGGAYYCGECNREHSRAKYQRIKAAR